MCFLWEVVDGVRPCEQNADFRMTYAVCFSLGKGTETVGNIVLIN